MTSERVIPSFSRKMCFPHQQISYNNKTKLTPNVYNPCIAFYWRNNSWSCFLCAKCNTEIYSKNVTQKQIMTILNIFYLCPCAKGKRVIWFFFLFYFFFLEGINSLKPHFCRQTLATVSFSGEQPEQSSGAPAKWELIRLRWVVIKRKTD